MKVKSLIYCLLAFCVLVLSSCGPDNTDYTEKVVGEYNIKITPNISVKYGNSVSKPAIMIFKRSNATIRPRYGTIMPMIFFQVLKSKDELVYSFSSYDMTIPPL